MSMIVFYPFSYVNRNDMTLFMIAALDIYIG